MQLLPVVLCLYTHTHTHTTDGDDLSALSTHSSDNDPPPSHLSPTPARPSVILVEGGGEESPELTPSEGEYDNLITSTITTTAAVAAAPQKQQSRAMVSLTAM